MDLGKYEEAAEELVRVRGSLRFEDTIKATYGRGELGLIGSPVSLLSRLTDGPLITTNFDRVIETAFEQQSTPITARVNGGHIGSALEALNRHERVIIKLHGDYAEAQDRVLTLAQYAAAYGSADPEKVDLSLPLPRLLRLVLQKRPLLIFWAAA